MEKRISSAAQGISVECVCRGVGAGRGLCSKQPFRNEAPWNYYSTIPWGLRVLHIPWVPLLAERSEKVLGQVQASWGRPRRAIHRFHQPEIVMWFLLTVEEAEECNLPVCPGGREMGFVKMCSIISAELAGKTHQCHSFVYLRDGSPVTNYLPLAECWLEIWLWTAPILGYVKMTSMCPGKLTTDSVKRQQGQTTLLVFQAIMLLFPLWNWHLCFPLQLQPIYWKELTSVTCIFTWIREESLSLGMWP